MRRKIKDENQDIIYKYKGITYSYLPFKNYRVDKIEQEGSTIYYTISKTIPLFIHIIIICSLISLLIILFININNNSSIDITHKARVPSEMYWDSKNKILDIDITNDESNIDTVISFKLIDGKSNKVILDVKGINQGESIGSLPIDDYEFNNLPKSYRLEYHISYKYLISKVENFNIIVIDKDKAESELNNDF